MLRAAPGYVERRTALRLRPAALTTTVFRAQAPTLPPGDDASHPAPARSKPGRALSDQIRQRWRLLQVQWTINGRSPYGRHPWGLQQPYERPHPRIGVVSRLTKSTVAKVLYGTPPRTSRLRRYPLSSFYSTDDGATYRRILARAESGPQPAQEDARRKVHKRRRA